MKVKVLQGVNLKNDITTVVAEMAAVKPELLEFFKKLHPVFMESYSINGNILEIQTRIPNFWKLSQILQQIEDFSMGKIVFDEARKKMTEIAKYVTGSMATMPILHSAHVAGYETIQFYINEGFFADKNEMNLDYVVGIGAEQQTVHAAASSKDTALSLKIQRSKMCTNQAIEEMGMPIAPWSMVDSKEEIPAAMEKVGYPCVMKPIGLNGGHGVQIGMNNIDEVNTAWDRIQEYINNEMKFSESKAGWQTKIMVQRMLSGKDFRMVVINGKFAVATNRIQARVIGDGKNTVAKLIEIENQNPARDLTLPTHTLKPIVVDKDLEKVLAKQGFDLNYVPKVGENVRVRDVASMSQGGITEDVTEKVHPQIRLICETIANTVHAYVLGIDVLANDISKPLTLDNGGIIEVNTMPEVYLNAYPVIGTPHPEISDLIIKGLVEGTPLTQKIVILGEATIDQIQAAIKHSIPAGSNYGLMYKGTIYINDNAINSGLSINETVLCLKKNKLLNAIVLHYSNLQELEENGFGFNKIDLLIDGLKDPTVTARINDLKTKGLISNVIA